MSNWLYLQHWTKDPWGSFLRRTGSTKAWLYFWTRKTPVQASPERLRSVGHHLHKRCFFLLSLHQKYTLTTVFSVRGRTGQAPSSEVFLPLDGSTSRSRGFSFNSENQYFALLLPGSRTNLQKTLQLSDFVCLGEFKTFCLREKSRCFFSFFGRAFIERDLHLFSDVMCYCSSVLAGSPLKKRISGVMNSAFASSVSSSPENRTCSLVNSKSLN